VRPNRTRRITWLLPVALLLGALVWALAEGSSSGGTDGRSARVTIAAPTAAVATATPSPTPGGSAPPSSAPAAAASSPAASTTPSAATPALPLAGRTITVDPGHNGGNFTHAQQIGRLVPDGNGEKECDTTGTAAPDGYREADFNWSVAERLRALLGAAGARVVMTRSSNTGVGPCVNERAAIGNRAHSDAAISIHADGGPPGGSGFAILTPAPIPGGGDGAILAPSHRLAVDLRAALVRIGLHTSTYDGHAGLAPRTDLGGLNLSTRPKVFVEVANMQNHADEAPMERSGYRELLARALLAGLERFLPAG
jgi:N-acetylmuramoyl-L-alanine amidase